MISSFKKTTKWAVVALALMLAAGCFSLNSPLKPKSSSQNKETTTINNQQITGTNINTSYSNSIVYQNTTYGFNFTLPKSWQGYSIVTENWTGNDASGKTTQTGPMISIRHPQWTSQKPRQDIPLLIFTINQWNSLQQEQFHIGAAPINPSKLGSNSSYVFALPARYNYAFPAGYEEVEKILKSHPLHTTNLNDSDSATAMLLNNAICSTGKSH